MSSIWTSADVGASWTDINVGFGYGRWTGISASEDGVALAAVTSYDRIWVSGDAGASWTEASSTLLGLEVDRVEFERDETAAVASYGTAWLSSIPARHGPRRRAAVSRGRRSRRARTAQRSRRSNRTDTSGSRTTPRRTTGRRRRIGCPSRRARTAGRSRRSWGAETYGSRATPAPRGPRLPPAPGAGLARHRLQRGRHEARGGLR